MSAPCCTAPDMLCASDHVYLSCWQCVSVFCRVVSLTLLLNMFQSMYLSWMLQHLIASAGKMHMQWMIISLSIDFCVRSPFCSLDPTCTQQHPMLFLNARFVIIFANVSWHPMSVGMLDIYHQETQPVHQCDSLPQHSNISSAFAEHNSIMFSVSFSLLHFVGSLCGVRCYERVRNLVISVPLPRTYSDAFFYWKVASTREEKVC